MGIPETLFNRAIIEPTIVVTGSIGKSDVVHMLMAAMAYGAIPPQTRVIEANRDALPRADVVIDVDMSATNSVCKIEDIQMQADCSCFLAVIGDHRAMIKVAMPGAHAIKHAMITLQVVDAMAGDLAKVALALANLKPRKGHGQIKKIGGFGNSCTVFDYSEHASMAGLEGALSHMSMAEAKHYAKKILILPRLHISSPEWFAQLLKQGKIDTFLTLDKCLANIASDAGLTTELFDKMAFMELRLERVLSIDDQVLIMGTDEDNVSQLLARISKRDDVVSHIDLPMAAE